MGPRCAPRWGEKDAGPNPTDRAKPGYKDHRLVDGRGVPLSTVVTPATVNDGPTLSLVLTNLPIVRPWPDRGHPQHLCLDAAFDTAPARAVVLLEKYTAHIAPKGGRAEATPTHTDGQARRWKVERTHAWHDRFRRLVVNWEKQLTTRYAFLCLANALIAYRM
jgi:putative transposase